MIKTIHQVIRTVAGEERIVRETSSIAEAKRIDKQMETVSCFLCEADRLISEGVIELPKGVKKDTIESFLENLFIEFSANTDGIKRALKGELMTPEKETKKPKPAKQTVKPQA